MPSVRAFASHTAAPLAPVASASSGRGAQARMDTAPNMPNRTAARDRPEADTETPAAERPLIDDFTLIGPTPAFQANVLELERDLVRAIEKLEAERSRVEAEAAIAVRQAEARADAAEGRQDIAARAAEANAPSAGTTIETPDPAPTTEAAPAAKVPAAPEPQAEPGIS